MLLFIPALTICYATIEMAEDTESDENSQGKKIEKRRKLPPLTLIEKEILLEIVNRSSILSVVENKKTNAVWTSQKTAMWEKVANEFCANANVTKRSGRQLKKAWDNLKSRCKKMVKD